MLLMIVNHYFFLLVFDLLPSPADKMDNVMKIGGWEGRRHFETDIYTNISVQTLQSGIISCMKQFWSTERQRRQGQESIIIIIIMKGSTSEMFCWVIIIK